MTNKELGTYIKRSIDSFRLEVNQRLDKIDNKLYNLEHKEAKKPIDLLKRKVVIK